MEVQVGGEGPSLTSSLESSLHCDLLTESIFDEKSILNYFNNQEQKDFKVKVIRNALKHYNVKTLSTLGMSNFGFVDTPLRKECWYTLLSEQLKFPDHDNNPVPESYKEHKDENQVSLDVKRSFTSVDNEVRKGKLRKLLERIIIKILRKYPKLSYYQGYHDVVSVFIVVFFEGCDYEEDDYLSLSGLTTKSDDIGCNGTSEDCSNRLSSASTEFSENDTPSKASFDEDKLFRCVEIFTVLYLRDFMMDTLDFPIDQLKLIPEFIKKDCKHFYKKLELDKIEPFFAISSILTVFSHEMKPCENMPSSIIFEIFDFVISSQSMIVPLAMYARLILENKDKIMKEYSANLANFENNVDLVHGVIQQVLVPTSYDENMWAKVLGDIRVNPSKEHFTKCKHFVNNYSTLLTTASGRLYIKYELKDVFKLLDKEIGINNKRKAAKMSGKLKRHDNKRSLVRLFTYQSLPLICKVSILVGLLAILVKLHRDGSMKTTIPGIKAYLKKLKGHSTAGIYKGLKYVWLDPLQELIKNPSLPNWASKVSKYLPS